MSEQVRRPELLDAAFGIGARLCREAIWDGDRCAWVGADEEHSPGGDVRVIQRASGPNLHDGSAGIALFLAHLYESTGERVLRTTALAAARHALSRLDSIPPPLRLSAFSGLSGIAFAVAQVADCADAEGLEEPALAALAGVAAGEEAAAWSEPPLLDVMAGSAGAIPLLLWLSGREGYEQRFLDLAAIEGERLLRHASRGDGGWSWHTMGDPADPDLCGYSHGASGIGVALLELWAATGDECLREAGDGAFAYEAGCFSPAAGNWPDLRPWAARHENGATGPAYSATWCHGAAGAALARLRAAELTGSAALLEEAETGLRTVRVWAERAGADADTCLCHGSAGPGEALAAGALALDAPELLDVALDRAQRHIDHERAGGVPTSGLLTGTDTPGLMLGRAGVGHHLLRLAAPPPPPSVLAPVPTGLRQPQR
jgi:lantibiotic modifying enzyme